MDLFQSFDSSHLLGSGGVAAAIVYVATRVVKPLLESFLDKMPNAIRENTEAVKALIESEQRASGYTREEHAQIATHLKLLTDTLLKVNGHTPDNPPTTDTTPLQTALSDPTTINPQNTEKGVNKSEFDALREDVSKIIAHLRD